MPTLVIPMTGAVDGTYDYIQRSNAVYAVARVTPVNANYAQPAEMYAGSVVGATYDLYAGLFKFDTSPIPDGATVTQAYIKMAANTIDRSAGDENVAICETNWAAFDPLDATGASMAGQTAAVNAGPSSGIWRSTFGMVSGTIYQSADLRAAYINKTGFTYYGIRSFEYDVGNVAPPAGNIYCGVFTPNSASPAKAPELTVVYSTGSLSPSSDVKMTGGMQDYAGGMRDYYRPKRRDVFRRSRSGSWLS